MVADAEFSLEGHGHHATLPRRSDWVRLWRLLASWSALIAVLSRVVMTLQAGFALSRFRGLDSVPRVTSLSATRGLTGGAASAGAVLAIVHWSHHREPAQLRKWLRPILIRGVLGTIAITPVVAVVALTSSFIAAAGAYGVALTTFLRGLQQTVTAGDCVVALIGATASGLIVVPIIGFLLPVLARTHWSLAAKLFTIWLGLFVVGAMCRILWG